MALFKVSDCDIVYLSYDEPNADKNYADILTKIPWAKRIHGVEGSDASHKACANIAETERFITVDGDNIVDPEFINETINFRDDIDLEKCVVSWSGYNVVNGLTYGNGGIKCWPTELVKSMKTHENADPNNIAAGIDFCWGLTYLQISKVYSYVYNNATPWQAWRAGFREGVKMSLFEGNKLTNIEFRNRVHKKNLDRLKIWCSTGADSENGLWAIYGAREGCYQTNCTDWDFVNVRDFEYLNKLWKDKYSKINEDDLHNEITKLGNELNNELGLGITDGPLEKEASKFFKNMYTNPDRVPHSYFKDGTKSNYDIVMITYNEPNAEQNYDKLKKKFPRAKRVDKVKGIHQAHIEAAKLCKTDLIWIVDGDATIVDDFNFDYVAPESEMNFVKVWRSRNPINNLEYGYGGIKLFPRQATLDMDTSRPDMTTSISRHFKPIKVVSNITAFNTGPFETWKSAFRECAKLSSKVIDRQKEDETNERLRIWTTMGKDRPFGEYAIKGAIAGREYGLSSSSDLRLINDFDWLYEQFSLTEEVELETETDENINQTDTIGSVGDIQKQVANSFNVPDKANPDNFIVDLLDRYETLYGGDVENLRRFYNDQDIHSIFKLSKNEDLRKAILEKNLHSIFRIVDVDEDVRKAILEKNLHSLFRIIDADEDVRKVVTEDNVHSLFRLLGDEHEELRKVIAENNLHSLFRLLGDEHEDLRSAMLDKNLYGLFRLLGSDHEELRKAMVEKNLHSIFRILDVDDDMRKSVTEENLHSIFRVLDTDDDVRKAVIEGNYYSTKRLLEKQGLTDEFKLLNNDRFALWRLLEKYTNSAFTKPLKSFYNNEIQFDIDCFSRGQLLSKKWLVTELHKHIRHIGTVYLCAGWYATIVPMFVENGIKFTKVRSFDTDPDVWKIAEKFNKELLLDSWKFKAQTKDIMDIDYVETTYETIKGTGDIEVLKDTPDTIINTSCEHITNFTDWYNKVPDGKLLILQTNNYFEIEEHVNCVSNIQEFAEMTPMSNVLYEGELPLDKYTRYMRIGYK